MFKRYSIPGSSPATLTVPEGHEGITPEIRLTEYTRTSCEEKIVTCVADLPSDCNDGKFRWIELNGLGDVAVVKALGEKYDLHPLALEDTLNIGQRPKMEMYDQHVFLIAQMVYRDGGSKLCTEQVSMFLSKTFLLTVQEEAAMDVFTPVRERLRIGRGFIRTLGPDYLAYALLDSIIDHMFPMLEAIGDGIEELEDEIIARPTKDAAHRLHEYKRMLMQLRRFTWPERDVISALLHDESGHVSKDTKVFLRDCYDHTVQIMELIESYRDLLSGLMDMYHSSLSLRTNEIMRVLTVISSIFIPLTFVAGVYGMNFAREVDGKLLPLNMPELYWPHGYLGCLAIMAAIAIGLLVFFRRKGWI